MEGPELDFNVLTQGSVSCTPREYCTGTAGAPAPEAKAARATDATPSLLAVCEARGLVAVANCGAIDCYHLPGASPVGDGFRMPYVGAIPLRSALPASASSGTAAAGSALVATAVHFTEDGFLVAGASDVAGGAAYAAFDTRVAPTFSATAADGDSADGLTARVLTSTRVADKLAGIASIDSMQLSGGTTLVAVAAAEAEGRFRVLSLHSSSFASPDQALVQIESEGTAAPAQRVLCVSFVRPRRSSASSGSEAFLATGTTDGAIHLWQVARSGGSLDGDSDATTVAVDLLWRVACGSAFSPSVVSLSWVPSATGKAPRDETVSRWVESTSRDGTEPDEEWESVDFGFKLSPAARRLSAQLIVSGHADGTLKFWSPLQQPATESEKRSGRPVASFPALHATRAPLSLPVRPWECIRGGERGHWLLAGALDAPGLRAWPVMEVSLQDPPASVLGAAERGTAAHERRAPEQTVASPTVKRGGKRRAAAAVSSPSARSTKGRAAATPRKPPTKKSRASPASRARTRQARSAPRFVAGRIATAHELLASMVGRALPSAREALNTPVCGGQVGSFAAGGAWIEGSDRLRDLADAPRSGGAAALLLLTERGLHVCAVYGSGADDVAAAGVAPRALRDHIDAAGVEVAVGGAGARRVSGKAERQGRRKGRPAGDEPGPWRSDEGERDGSASEQSSDGCSAAESRALDIDDADVAELSTVAAQHPALHGTLASKYRLPPRPALGGEDASDDEPEGDGAAKGSRWPPPPPRPTLAERTDSRLEKMAARVKTLETRLKQVRASVSLFTSDVNAQMLQLIAVLEQVPEDVLRAATERALGPRREAGDDGE